MGFLEELREKHAAGIRQAKLAAWEAEQQALQHELDLAQNFRGLPDADGLQLQAGELRYFTLSGAPLLEMQRTQGHRTGVYGGPSFRVAKGVYMRSGAFRSHYVPGVEELEQVDIGTAHITDRRAVFIGGKQTREFPFAKLIGYEHHPEGHYTQFSIQGRQQPSCIRYGDQGGDWCFRLDLAHAQFAGERDGFTASLRQELADHAEAKPPANP